MLSVVEPQSVPSRISVVLVEEAKVGGTQCLGCPRVDQNLRLLAGVAKPASVTVCDDSHVSPGVGGTLSSSDLAGRLFPVVPAGTPFPVGLVGPVGPFNSEPVGPDGPYVGPVGPGGMQSPSDAELVGPDGPYVGPVGPCVTQSPSDAELVGPDGPQVGPVGPSYSELVGPYVGPVGPFNSDPVGPDGPYVGLVGPDTVTKGPVGPGGTVSSPNPAGIPFLAMPAGILLPVGPLALLARMGRCPRLTPILRYWWTLVGCSLHLTWPV